jgi:allantoinase
MSCLYVSSLFLPSSRLPPSPVLSLRVDWKTLTSQYYLSSPVGDDQGLLVVPTTLDTDDMRHNVAGQGFGTAADYLQYLTDTFKLLYAEGEKGTPKMMTVPIHPRIVGHGSRAFYFEQ